MGIEQDIKRLHEVGEDKREDLSEFIQYGDLSQSDEDTIRVPIKIVSLPEFEYDQVDKGGIGQAQEGDVEEGDTVEVPDEDEDGDEAGEDSEGIPGLEDMDPEEFAEALDEELDLDLDPKGKKVIEEAEGDLTDRVRSGPSSTLSFDELFKNGLKRKIATETDEEFLRELLCVSGFGPQKAFEWARAERNIPISKGWLSREYDKISGTDKTKWDSVDELLRNKQPRSNKQLLRDEGVSDIVFRKEDERYKYPEVEEKRESQVVVINIRDVSGSMRRKKRELIKRTYAPLDWYLQGKYDNAIFIYIAHNSEAWEVERAEFFNLKSGGGTKISAAYELTEDLLEEYQWETWNRYVFAGGDSENQSSDTKDNVIPLMKEIDANLHAYVEAQPDDNSTNATHADTVEEEFEDSDDVQVARVNSNKDTIDAIEKLLSES